VGWRKVNAKKSRKADEETNAPTAEKSETIAGKSDEKKVVS
jgi:hypothetical protein